MFKPMFDQVHGPYQRNDCRQGVMPVLVKIKLQLDVLPRRFTALHWLKYSRKFASLLVES